MACNSFFHGKTKMQVLKELRSLVCFERARFSRPECGHWPDLKSEEYTEEIRKATRLYRESLVLPIIDALIEEEKRKKEKAKAYRRGTVEGS